EDLLRTRGGTISFTSLIASTGSCFTNSRNHMKNQPNEPAMNAMSTHDGVYVVHCQGSNSCDSDGITITKRSNHIPMLMKIERMNSHIGFRRRFCEKSESGRIMLHVSNVHSAHHHWPNVRFQKYSCSAGTPEYQAMKNSMRYALPTTREVSRTTFAVASRWLSVT